MTTLSRLKGKFLNVNSNCFHFSVTKCLAPLIPHIYLVMQRIINIINNFDIILILSNMQSHKTNNTIFSTTFKIIKRNRTESKILSILDNIFESYSIFYICIFKFIATINRIIKKKINNNEL